MRLAFGTFLACVAVALTAYGISQLRALHAAPIEHLSNFKEQLALSPHMFDGAMKEDRPDLAEDQHGGRR